MVSRGNCQEMFRHFIKDDFPLKIKMEKLENSLTKLEKESSIISAALTFIPIKNSVYLNPSDKIICKDSLSMECECKISEAQKKRREKGCIFNCINRLLYIECGNNCQLGKFCDNKHFQRSRKLPISLFFAGIKGIGVQADADMPSDSFIIEYVGEVFDGKTTKERAREYRREGINHIYVMQLHLNLRIDATRMGNISRFLNHSCNPNAITQKWTVNGELRIGFFTSRYIKKGEEITIDYQFNGKNEQRCFCGSDNCRGWLEKSLKKEENESDRMNKPHNPNSGDFEEIEILTKSGIKNKQQTISLLRLIHRTKDINLRLSLLNILKSADHPCRRLFLEHNGLRLLYNWMCDTKDSNSIPNHLLYVELLNAFDLLPITNITMLRKSNVLDKVEQLAGKEALKQYDLEINNNDETAPNEVLEELPTLKIIIKEKSNELLQKWMKLKEDFKIPTLKKIKKEPDDEIWNESFAIPTFPTPAIPTQSLYSNNDIRYRNEVRRDSITPKRFISRSPSVHSPCPSPSPSTSTLFVPPLKYSRSSIPSTSSNNYLKNGLTQSETEIYMKKEHKKNCDIFDLPETTLPIDVPQRVNRATGEYFNLFGMKVDHPPNHNLLKKLYKPLPYDLSTNPNDYELPPMNLPKHWKYAIDKRGRTYFFHKKHRKSQWEPPLKNEISDDSSTDTEDSEEEWLNERLIYLKRKSQRKFNNNSNKKIR